MRTLGLAQGLGDMGHDVSFLHLCPEALRERLRSSGFESVHLDAVPGSPEDVAATNHRAGELAAEWIVGDGYSFSSAFQRSLQDAGHRLLLVDDNGDADGYPADIVLNQSLHAAPSLYGAWYDQGRFLLGPDYVLLREEFRKWIGQKHAVAATPRRLLVCLGGLPDPAWVADVLPGLSDIPMDVTIAAGLPLVPPVHLDRNGSIQYLSGVHDMAELIMHSDIGLTAAGGTAKEFLFLGLPFAVVEVAENQTSQAQFLATRKLARRLGPIAVLDNGELSNVVQSLAIDFRERMRMSEAGQALIDGYGVERVAAALTG